MIMKEPATRRSCLVVFGTLVLVATAWALYTRHAWEDYYITYRAAKNLATGHGLTFTAGERVHSFTSPLGVLLPALASVLAGNRSDVAALWIFRAMSIAAFAGAGTLLWKLGCTLFSRVSAMLLVAFFATDTKIVDFSTNGMETGFLLFFLAWTLFALLTEPPRLDVNLGLAWAGLMWTRPDSFIYIGALGVGAWLIRPAAELPPARAKSAKVYLRAAVITSALYLPWLIWAWIYYGSPIPHTIVAKGLFQPTTNFSLLWHMLRSFPSMVFRHWDIPATTFMPPYSFNTGWPTLALQTSFWVSLAVMCVWLIPGVRRETRVASFAFAAGQFYLTNYVSFPVPWYIPTLTTFAIIVIVSLTDQLLGSDGTHRTSMSVRGLLSSARALGVSAVVLLWVGTVMIFGMAAYQLRWQQRLVEEGERREIGQWLRSAAASPRDTVFLEPLGYIGFYSNLKMLDYPGLSSPEVVAARKRTELKTYPECWPDLILDLAPNWVAVRTNEADTIRGRAPDLFKLYYTLAKTFDVRAKINAIPAIAGRGYLLNDAYFEVYHRTIKLPHEGESSVGFRPVTAKNLEVNESWGRPAYDSGLNLISLAPSRLVFEKPAGARWFSGQIGIFEGAYADPKNATDGAGFAITLIYPDGTRRELLHRLLNPRDVATDRGKQSFSVELPATPTQTCSIELVTSPGPSNSNAYDWTYWSTLLLEIPHNHPGL